MNSVSNPKIKSLIAQAEKLLPDHLNFLTTDEGLHLGYKNKTTSKPIKVDFVTGQAAHRRQYGGGRGQLIARAVGLKKSPNSMVLDVTAGLGRDAFVLASLGCDVTMVERSTVMAALLQDGLNRLKKDPASENIMLNLLSGDARDVLKNLPQSKKPDVVYMDPMFPHRDKTALVKKEMRILRELVGDDLDAAELLELALKTAKKRVVVKRSKLAPHLTQGVPDLIFRGKSSRYDVYLVAAL